jgi:hypothetical protein
MTGKILLPLKRLINAEKNIDFDIQCSWTLWSFSLTLRNSDLHIHVVKRLWE